MTIEKSHTNAELGQAVEQVLRALTGDGALRAGVSLDALAYVTALILDLDPSVTAKSHLREAVETQAAATLRYLRAARDHAETSGRHLLETIGGTAELDPGIIAGMTRQ